MFTSSFYAALFLAATASYVNAQNNATALDSSEVDCFITVPANPLTAEGLASAYILQPPCSMAVDAQQAFVEAAVFDPATGGLSIYHPLVTNAGEQPAAAPVVPKLPNNAIVGIWYGFNGGTLQLIDADGKDANNSPLLKSAECVNGLPGVEGDIFGQVSWCNAEQWFAAVNKGIKAGTVKVPELGTDKNGNTCPTSRSFSITDADPSDNVPTQYILIGNTTAQDTDANRKQFNPEADTINNASDEALLTNIIDPLIGCTPFLAPSLDNPGAMVPALALSELQAALEVNPALVPLNDPDCLLTKDSSVSVEKTNIYRRGVNQPDVGTGATSGALQPYCDGLVAGTPTFLKSFEKTFLGEASPDAEAANNLLTFLAARYLAALDTLKCPAPKVQPVTCKKDGQGVTTSCVIDAVADVGNNTTTTSAAAATTTLANNNTTTTAEAAETTKKGGAKGNANGGATKITAAANTTTAAGAEETNKGGKGNGGKGNGGKGNGGKGGKGETTTSAEATFAANTTTAAGAKETNKGGKNNGGKGNGGKGGKGETTINLTTAPAAETTSATTASIETVRFANTTRNAAATGKGGKGNNNGKGNNGKGGNDKGTTTLAESASAISTAAASAVTTNGVTIITKVIIIEHISFFIFIINLGGHLPPAVLNSEDATTNYLVKDEVFPALAPACQRACNLQFDACSNAASKKETKFAVADCKAQEDKCLGVAATATPSGTAPATMTATATVVSTTAAAAQATQPPTNNNGGGKEATPVQSTDKPAKDDNKDNGAAAGGNGGNQANCPAVGATATVTVIQAGVTSVARETVTVTVIAPGAEATTISSAFTSAETNIVVSTETSSGAAAATASTGFTVSSRHAARHRRALGKY